MFIFLGHLVDYNEQCYIPGLFSRFKVNGCLSVCGFTMVEMDKVDEYEIITNTTQHVTSGPRHFKLLLIQLFIQQLIRNNQQAFICRHSDTQLRQLKVDP